MIKLNNFSFSPGFFGKLPEFNDFVKFNAAGIEILVFDKWLQDGLLYAKNKLKDEWENFYFSALPYKFFLPFTGTDNFILGICFAGIDKSKRCFPFLIFFLVPKNIFKEIPFFFVPLVFDEIFICLDKFYSENLHSTNIVDISNNLKNTNITISTFTRENEYRDYLFNTAQKKFWQRTVCTFEDQEMLPELYGLRFINNLLEFKSRADFPAGFRFDFRSDDSSKLFDLCFFLNLVKNLKVDSIPAFFWSEKNNIVRLFVFKEKPLRENFLDLICSSSENDKILTGITKPNRNMVQPSVNEYLENNEINLDQLLNVFLKAHL